MCTQRSFALVFIIGMFLKEDSAEYISKCCSKGMQLETDMQSCIPIENMEQSHITLEIIKDSVHNSVNYWIPEEFLNRTNALEYNALPDLEDADVLGVSYYKESEAETLFGRAWDDIEGKIDTALVKETNHCFDTSVDSSHKYVQITGYSLKPFYKCCAKGEMLKRRVKECTPIPGFESNEESDEDEIIGIPRPPEFMDWFPNQTSESVLKVSYDSLQKGSHYDFTILVDSEFQWKFAETEPFETKAISFRGRDKFNNIVSGTTEIFCFDRTLVKSKFQRVLLASVYSLSKCCRRGEQMKRRQTQEVESQEKSSDNATEANQDDDHKVCVVRPGQFVEEIENGFADWRNNSQDTYWLPSPPENVLIPVQFNVIHKMDRFTESLRFISNHSLWSVNYGSETSLPTLVMNLTDVHGQEFSVTTQSFCFEYLESFGKVVVSDVPKPEHTISKCCFEGEVISPSGRCVKHGGVDWAPELSSIFSQKENTIDIRLPVPPDRFCHRGTLRIIPKSSPRAVDHLLGYHIVQNKVSIRAYCNDWLLNEDGGVEEVVSECTYKGLAEVHAGIRPLGVVSAVLLAAAAVSAAVRKDTRRTAQGRALACHALCLCVSNSLQVSWFFMWPVKLTECVAHSFATYFFMVAANWWLAVITFSIFHNFRKPLGALAITGQRSAKKEWIRFGIMSVTAWGGSSALTTLAVVMYKYKDVLQPKGIITPSFFETRTCPFEIAEKIDDIVYVYWNELWNRPLGSVCFYFTPMALLGVLNLVLIVLTVRYVRALRRGESILQRDGQMQHALLYAKLLLTSGALELILEVATWLAGRSAFSIVDSTDYWFFLIENIYIFETAVTLVDLVRAISVFWLTTRCPWPLANRAWRQVKVLGGRVAMRFAPAHGRVRRWAEATRVWVSDKVGISIQDKSTSLGDLPLERSTSEYELSARSSS